MKNELSPEALKLLRELAENAMLETSQQVTKFRTYGPDHAGHADAKARLRVCAELLLAANVAEDIPPASYDLPHSRDELQAMRDRAAPYDLPHSHDELQAMRDHGLDPMKELGPHDPRARDPRCVHGRKFSEECEACEKPLAVEVAARAAQESAQLIPDGT